VPSRVKLPRRTFSGGELLENIKNTKSKKILGLLQRDPMLSIFVTIFAAWVIVLSVSGIKAPTPEGSYTLTQAVNTCSNQDLDVNSFYSSDTDFRGTFYLSPEAERTGTSEFACLMQNLPIGDDNEAITQFIVSSLEGQKTKSFGPVFLSSSPDFGTRQLVIEISLPIVETRYFNEAIWVRGEAISFGLLAIFSLVIFFRFLRRRSIARDLEFERVMKNFAPEGLIEKLDELLEPAREASAKKKVELENELTLGVIETLRQEVGAVDRKSQVLNEALRMIRAEQDLARWLFKGAVLIASTPGNSVQLWSDRVRLGIESHKLTKDTFAEVHLEGSKQINYTTKMKASTMALGVVLPGRAMNWASLDPKAVKHQDDTRSASLLVLSDSWSYELSIDPDQVTAYKAFAHKINSAAKKIK
jgi:hypothetical protein